MKYKHVIEPLLDSVIEVITSVNKGIDMNTISKDEVKLKLNQINETLKKIAETVSIEHDTY